MSCSKCEDIHGAQRSGFISRPCECDCHSGFSWFPNYSLTITGAEGTDDTDASLTLCSPNGCSTVNLN